MISNINQISGGYKVSKRDYSNYNVLDDDVKEEKVQEVAEEEADSKEYQQDKIQEKISQDQLVEKINLNKVEIHKEEEKLEEPLIIQEETEKTTNQSAGQMIDKIDKQANDTIIEKRKLEKISTKSNFFHKDNPTNDSTIPEYKRFYEQKERSNFFKWCMRFARTAILVMLLPLWACIALGILLVIGGFLFSIAGFMGTGLFILGIVCFISSQISLSIIALGVSIAITCIAIGGIILIIFSAVIKWVIGLVRKYRKPRKKEQNKEVI